MVDAADWDRYLADLAEQDGAEAYVAGETLDANPFVADTPNHAAWVRGWKEAQALNVR